MPDVSGGNEGNKRLYKASGMWITHSPCSLRLNSDEWITFRWVSHCSLTAAVRGMSDTLAAAVPGAEISNSGSSAVSHLSLCLCVCVCALSLHLLKLDVEHFRTTLK